jgi:hypothetical protein
MNNSYEDTAMFYRWSLHANAVLMGGNLWQNSKSGKVRLSVRPSKERGERNQKAKTPPLL